ncbi:hypothetical protein IKP85_04475 [bacterium]|nr:hypothetical protein [bacterium]
MTGDMQRIAEQIRNNPAIQGRVEVINVQARTGTPDIGGLLRTGQIRANGTPATSDGADPQKEVVSKENAKYKDHDGMLIRYADGTVDFVVDSTKGNNKLRNILSFKNEKDFTNTKPEKQTHYKAVTKDGQTTFEKVQETTYKYHHNGKISYSETKDAEGIILNKAEYNKDGKVTKKIVNDKEGNLQFTYKYKYEKDGTRLSEKYDKDDKLVLTGETKYNGDKPVSTVTKYPGGQVACEVTYDENGKKQTQKDYYENGQIKADTVYHDNGVIKTQTLYDEQGNITKKITDEIDGNFEHSAQVSEGDCYLMSAINGIRETEEGQKILSDLVQVTTNENGEKVYTVTLPGAQLAAEGLKTDSRIKPGTVAITGTYTFTEAEMQEILKQAGRKYSLGDGDVVLLEAAFEKYRMEVSETLKANDIAPGSVGQGDAGLQTGMDENNILAGGQAEDALFILTGKPSKVYSNKKTQYGLSYEDLQQDKVQLTPMGQTTSLVAAQSNLKATSSIDGPVTNQKDELDEMLDQIMNDSQDGHIDNVATASFALTHKDGKVSGHALTIKSVTADTVTLVNPWHPDKEITMSREDFKRSAKKVTVASMTDSPSGNDSNKPDIHDIINHIIGNNGQIGNGGQGHGNGQLSEETQQAIIQAAEHAGIHTNSAPQVHGSYTIPRGISYTNMIKEMLRQQGIEPTAENIRKAKEQFEALNPGAVKTYNGRRQDWKGNRYVIAYETVKVPKFVM